MSEKHPPVAVLERSLLEEVKYVHKSCGNFIFPPGHPNAGCCSACRMLLTKKGKTAPLHVFEKYRSTMFFYRLPDGRLYGTHFGIWNQN